MTLHLMLPFILSQEQEKIIKIRLQEFSHLHTLGNEIWFNELCFCLLTANSQAKRAIEIQKNLGVHGFLEESQENIAYIIKSFGHRFHNTKAKYIVLARKHKNIKDLLINLTSAQAREFLVNNIKGIGYKEASHFLRNVGYEDLAIIDRHIIRFLHQNQLIEKMPTVITKKLYLFFETILQSYHIKLDQLDLMIWCHMTGTILK